MGLSQDELGRRIGMDRGRLSRIEHNTNQATNEQLVVLARELKTNTHYILTGEEISPDPPENFSTPEANEIGALIDGMDEDMRRGFLHLIRDFAKINEERRDLQTDYAVLLAEVIAQLEGELQEKARLILSRINRYKQR